jgi:hypothetical protein
MLSEPTNIQFAPFHHPVGKPQHSTFPPETRPRSATSCAVNAPSGPIVTARLPAATASPAASRTTARKSAPYPTRRSVRPVHGIADGRKRRSLVPAHVATTIQRQRPAPAQQRKSPSALPSGKHFRYSPEPSAHVFFSPRERTTQLGPIRKPLDLSGARKVFPDAPRSFSVFLCVLCVL